MFSGWCEASGEKVWGEYTNFEIHSMEIHILTVLGQKSTQAAVQCSAESGDQVTRRSEMKASRTGQSTGQVEHSAGFQVPFGTGSEGECKMNRSGELTRGWRWRSWKFPWATLQGKSMWERKSYENLMCEEPRNPEGRIDSVGSLVCTWSHSDGGGT